MRGERQLEIRETRQIKANVYCIKRRVQKKARLLANYISRAVLALSKATKLPKYGLDESANLPSFLKY